LPHEHLNGGGADSLDAQEEALPRMGGRARSRGRFRSSRPGALRLSRIEDRPGLAAAIVDLEEAGATASSSTGSIA
jgi:hypothetical protein